MFHHFRDDCAPDGSILLDEVEPRLAGFLARARRQHGYGCARTVGIVARPDARGMSEGHGVIEVHRLAFRLGAVGVNQNDFGCQATEKQRISEGRTHIAYTHNSDTHRPSMVFRISFTVDLVRQD